jgi:hypothetical protein
MKYPNGFFKDKACRTCDKIFTPTAPSQKYCSVGCRGKTAYYERVYGITESEYRNMLKEQHNLCAICGSEGFLIGNNGHTELLAVDHDHETEKVRGLLCHNCNRALGLFQDRIDNLKSAIKYLRKTR